ncbi:MAG: ATP synthase subunit I [Thermoanaerobaculia bacterium]
MAELCHPEAAEGAEPKAKTPEDGEGSQNSQLQPEPRNVNTVPAGAANFEILHRPPPLALSPDAAPAAQDDRPSPDESAPVVLRRIRLIAAAAWIVFAVPVLMTGGWRGLLGLTCSGLVTMINFLWLEEIVDTLLQPTPARHPWRLTVRTLSRFALLGVALLVTIFVARINAVSVLLGFSIVVAGIMGEAVYSTIRTFAE